MIYAYSNNDSVWENHGRLTTTGSSTITFGSKGNRTINFGEIEIKSGSTFYLYYYNKTFINYGNIINNGTIDMRGGSIVNKHGLRKILPDPDGSLPTEEIYETSTGTVSGSGTITNCSTLTEAVSEKNITLDEFGSSWENKSLRVAGGYVIDLGNISEFGGTMNLAAGSIIRNAIISGTINVNGENVTLDNVTLSEGGKINLAPNVFSARFTNLNAGGGTIDTNRGFTAESEDLKNSISVIFINNLNLTAGNLIWNMNIDRSKLRNDLLRIGDVVNGAGAGEHVIKIHPKILGSSSKTYNATFINRTGANKTGSTPRVEIVE
jgi:hypothetical protein